MRICPLFFAALLLAACGAGDEEDGGAFGGSGDDGFGACASDNDCPADHVCFRNASVFQGGEGPRAADAGALPPEMERTAEPFTRPAAGRDAVWVASPATDRVVAIDARTLAIAVVEVGDQPTEVATRAGTDVAVVLNRGSDELAVVEGPDDVTFHPLPGHFNALTLSPDGRYAFCWFDLDRARAGEDASALQDLAVVDLAAGTVHALAVGFRPRRIQFTADGDVALVITEDGLSIVRPAGLPPSALARTVPTSADLFATAQREVAVSPDGRWAVSRALGEPGVTVVALNEGLPRFVPLGAQPTDLDLLPDGRTALVMLRDAERLALVSLEAAIVDPDTVRFVDFPGHLLGSAVATPGGDLALLYSTATPEGTTPQLALLDLESQVMVHRPLRKGVAGVSVDPSGRVAFVLHDKQPGEADPALDEATFIARSHGYSLVDLDTTFAKLQTTPAEPRGLTFTGDAAGEGPHAAFVLFDDPVEGVAELQRIDLAGFEVRRWRLGSPPEVAGVLPAVSRAFVTQTHPEGRISFVDLAAEADRGRLETVSGYTLNGRIE